MTTTHTPGPWSYGHMGINSFWVGVDHASTPVCLVEHDTDFAHEESRENARLIAAAPELLAALEWSIQFIDTYATKQSGPATPEINKCRAAIAKARGKS